MPPARLTDRLHLLRLPQLLGGVLERQLGGHSRRAVALERARHPAQEREQRDPETDEREEQQHRERRDERAHRVRDGSIRLVQLEDRARPRVTRKRQRHVDLERLLVVTRAAFVVELRDVVDDLPRHDVAELGDVVGLLADQRVHVRVGDHPVAAAVELDAQRAVDEHAALEEPVQLAQPLAAHHAAQVLLRELLAQEAALDVPCVPGDVAFGRSYLRSADVPEERTADDCDDDRRRRSEPKMEVGEDGHRDGRGSPRPSGCGRRSKIPQRGEAGRPHRGRPARLRRPPRIRSRVPAEPR